MGGIYYTEDQLRADDGSSPFDDGRTTINQMARHQDQAASAENKGPGGEKMHWFGSWDNQASYEKNSVVIDGQWTMIANKSTSDRPAPQPMGSPLWISGLGDTPTWTPNTKVSTQLIRGQRYTIQKSGYILNARIWVENIAQSYRYASVVNPSDPNAPRSLSAELPVVTPGWLEIGTGTRLLLSGTVLDFMKLVSDSAGSATVAGTWFYSNPGAPAQPGSGIINHPVSQSGTMQISKVDYDSVDRSAELAGLSTGDTISGAGMVWEVTYVTDNGVWFDLGVYPISLGSPIGPGPFTFELFTDQGIDYVYIPNHFAADPNIDGFWSETGYDDIALTDHAYGVDILVQDAYISADWNLVSYSSS